MRGNHNVALAATLLLAGPALAGTPTAGLEELASMSIVGEAAPMDTGTREAPAVCNSATDKPGGRFETLVADFRWGEPEMGAVPFLPVPPPYRMRAENANTDAQKSDDSTILSASDGDLVAPH